MKIASKDAGYVIGRRGENIRDIQDKTNTRIHFLDESENLKPTFLKERKTLNGRSE